MFASAYLFVNELYKLVVSQSDFPFKMTKITFDLRIKKINRISFKLKKKINY